MMIFGKLLEIIIIKVIAAVQVKIQMMKKYKKKFQNKKMFKIGGQMVKI